MTTPSSNPEEEPAIYFNGDSVRASWPFSLHDVRTNMAHCAPEAREIVISAFLWCIDPAHPVTIDEFAKAIKYDRTTVWKVLAGKYKHAISKARLDVPPKMVSSARLWLKLEKERVEGGKTEFVMTPTARRIQVACDLGRESQTPVFVIGPSHIGKTWALENYTAANNHGRTVMARMKAASGLGGMVRRINERIGNSPKCNTAAAIERIKKGLTPDSLLILDEMHELAHTYRKESFFACIEVIREIYDETKCGVVLSATELLLSKMNEGQHGEMEQMLRRGVHRVRLPGMPTKEDLTLIFKHSGLAFPEKDEEVTVAKITERPRALIRQLAKTAGLKAITERLRYGRKLAAKTKETLTWAHVIDAHLRIEKQAEITLDWD
jgi:DNA transposition AAA+ family ATPase